MGEISLKKVLFILLFGLFLVGCSDDEPDEVSADEEKLEVEVIAEKEHNITLVDNDDLGVMLISSKHERFKDSDVVNLLIEIENKKDKTFEYSFSNLTLDGNREVTIAMDTFEVKPNETIRIDIKGVDTSHLEFEEYISGEFSYNDYTSEIHTDKETFSEYIN